MPKTQNQTYLREQITLLNYPPWTVREAWAFRFKSVTEFDNFIETMTNTSIGAAQRILRNMLTLTWITNDIANNGGINWYGTIDPNDIKKNLSAYLYRADLMNLTQQLTTNVQGINVTDLDQKKVIKFTDQPIGIFSFDLASIGLIKVYEYFSPLLNEIVSPNSVEGEKTPNGIRFYFKEQPFIPLHAVKFTTDGYYSSIIRNVVAKSLLIYDPATDTYYHPETQAIPRHEVIRRHATDAVGRGRYTSTFKKSFIYMPKVQKPLPKIDVIVPFSFDGSTNASDMQYNCLTALVLCDTLSRLGIDFNLIAYYGVTAAGGGPRKAFNQYIVLKDTTMGFDMNQMALFLSDPRYYRYQRFRGINSMFSDTDNDSYGGDGVWSTIDDPQAIKTAYLQMLALSKEPIDQDSARNPNGKIVTRKALNIQEATAAFDEVMQYIRTLV